MKVYVATSGEYSDFRIEHVFARQEDAESSAGADSVTEFEVREEPVEMRSWHTLTWNPGLGDCERTSFALENPYEQSWLKDFDGRPEYAVHHWAGPPERTGPVLQIEGWDPRRVRKVYSEQRARYLAGMQTLADRVWYSDGSTAERKRPCSLAQPTGQAVNRTHAG